MGDNLGSSFLVVVVLVFLVLVFTIVLVLIFILLLFHGDVHRDFDVDLVGNFDHFYFWYLFDHRVGYLDVFGFVHYMMRAVVMMMVFMMVFIVGFDAAEAEYGPHEHCA